MRPVWRWCERYFSRVERSVRENSEVSTSGMTTPLECRWRTIFFSSSESPWKVASVMKNSRSECHHKMSSIFIFLGSNPKNREKAADTPEKGRWLAVRGSNDKIIFSSNCTTNFTSVTRNLARNTHKERTLVQKSHSIELNWWILFERYFPERKLVR
jgi:hypothetical protein